MNKNSKSALEMRDKEGSDEYQYEIQEPTMYDFIDPRKQG